MRQKAYQRGSNQRIEDLFKLVRRVLDVRYFRVALVLGLLRDVFKREELKTAGSLLCKELKEK